MFWRNIQKIKRKTDKKKITEKMFENTYWPENKNILKISKLY